MRKTLSVIFASLLMAIPLSVMAGDGDKPEKTKAAEKSDKETETKEKKDSEKSSKEEETSDNCKGGNFFTRFWTKTVGGSIGHGLKHGTNKVTKAFGSED
jgi:hypothetical protein